MMLKVGGKPAIDVPAAARACPLVPSILICEARRARFGPSIALAWYASVAAEEIPFSRSSDEPLSVEVQLAADDG
ncbi:hypothetical protein [Nonomuraea sp. NPDC003214]